jgi:hypothetical protein
MEDLGIKTGGISRNTPDEPIYLLGVGAFSLVGQDDSGHRLVLKFKSR